jgi:hypothetical protein
VPNAGKQKMHTLFLVWNPRAKKSLERSRCRLKENVKMHFRESGWERVD